MIRNDVRNFSYCKWAVSSVTLNSIISPPITYRRGNCLHMLRILTLLSVALACCRSSAEKYCHSFTDRKLQLAFLSRSSRLQNHAQYLNPSCSSASPEELLFEKQRGCRRCLWSTSGNGVDEQSSSFEVSSSSKKVFTLEDLQEFALQEGIELSKTTLGPGFRTVARSTHDRSKILGYAEGFVRPTGNLLHLDKMEVFKPIVKQVKKENPVFRGGGTLFGVGLIFGYQCLLHGVENGCVEAEFLAIDDEDFQHKRLVKFYKYSGFKIIKYVGEDIQDIPDRMVWGGCGTLMRANISDLLSLWSEQFIEATNTRKSPVQ